MVSISWVHLVLLACTDLGSAAGAPSSLPIASAYGAYPPYDPYAAYYGYGYGYDPYAAYGTQPYGVPNGMPLPVAEEERYKRLLGHIH